MINYTGIKISEKTKIEFDKQRTLPQGIVTADEFLTYLLEQNKKRK